MSASPTNPGSASSLAQAAGVPICRFSAFDTWFFRESRPTETIGGSELACVFPPPMGTVAGALRTALGEHLGIDWEEPNQAPDALHEEARALIGTAALGTGDCPGSLRLAGPWLARREHRHWLRLYPAPANLMAKCGGEWIASVHRRKAISVNKHTAWLVFSPTFCVAAAGTELDYAPAAAP